MDKTDLTKKIADCLRESLDILDKAARAAHAEATHESSKAENKYDTRGLEASYLAAGQARQAKETLEAIQRYENLEVKNFGPGEAIDLTAVVELAVGSERSFYFIGPSHGGLEIMYQGREITVITPSSPLGQKLMGKKAGERWTENSGKAAVKHQIVSVV